MPPALARLDSPLEPSVDPPSSVLFQLYAEAISGWVTNYGSKSLPSTPFREPISKRNLFDTYPSAGGFRGLPSVQPVPKQIFGDLSDYANPKGLSVDAFMRPFYSSRRPRGPIFREISLIWGIPA